MHVSISFNSSGLLHCHSKIRFVSSFALYCSLTASLPFLLVVTEVEHLWLLLPSHRQLLYCVSYFENDSTRKVFALSMSSSVWFLFHFSMFGLQLFLHYAIFSCLCLSFNLWYFTLPICYLMRKVISLV